MVCLVQMVFPQMRTRYTPRLNVHLDNYPVHFSKVTEQFIIENQLLHLPHPPYSPTWPRQTSGDSGVSKLDSLAEEL
jgi:hypothetical protein